MVLPLLVSVLLMGSLSGGCSAASATLDPGDDEPRSRLAAWLSLLWPLAVIFGAAGVQLSVQHPHQLIAAPFCGLLARTARRQPDRQTAAGRKLLGIAKTCRASWRADGTS